MNFLYSSKVDAAFTDNSDGTITDTKTNLMWQSRSDNWLISMIGVTGYEAVKTCSKSRDGGYSDWELPESSLFDDLYNNTIPFPSKQANYYWTSDFTGPNRQVIFSFKDGKKYADYQSQRSASVRCVRLIFDSDGSDKDSKDDQATEHKFPLTVYAAWSKYGFTPAEVGEWGNVSVGPSKATSSIGPKEAHDYKAAGLLPSEALQCRAIGINPEVATVWKEQGLPCNEIRSWENIGLMPIEASAWRSIPLSASEARTWIDNQFLPSDVQPWVQQKIGPLQAKAWKESDFNPDTATPWNDAFFNAPDARSWEKLGVSPENAKKWREIGFKPEIASKWINSGMKLDQARQWHDAGFTPDNSFEWLQTGKTLKQAKPWVGFSPKTANSLSKFCSTGIEGIKDIVLENPYETRNKCYQLQMVLLQLQGRSKGLYRYFDQIFFVDFGKNAAETTYITGYFLGNGAFEYVDVSGAARTVPSLKKISIK